MLSLGLIISHYQGKVFLCVLHDVPRILRFSSLADGNRQHFRSLVSPRSESEMTEQCLILSGDSFLSLREFPHTQTDQYTRGPCTGFQGVFSMQLSSLWCSVLSTWAQFFSADSQVCLLTVQSLLGSSWVPLTVLWPGTYLNTVIWGNEKARLISLFNHVSGITVLRV